MLWRIPFHCFKQFVSHCVTLQRITLCHIATAMLKIWLWEKLLLPLGGFAVSDAAGDKKQFMVPKVLSLCWRRVLTSVAHLLSCTTIPTNTDSSAKHSGRCQILIPAGTFLSCLNVFVVFLISIIQMLGYGHKIDHVQYKSFYSPANPICPVVRMFNMNLTFIGLCVTYIISE